jgi:CBS domain-containing membrane protein
MIKSSPQAGNALAALKMCSKDIMQTQVLFGSPEDSVQQALSKMQQAQSNCMIIGKDNLPEGIITTYDLTSAISIYLKPVFAKWRRPSDDATLQIKLKWLMTRPVRTVKSDAPISSVMETICQTGVRCLPVVGAGGKVEGLITVFDIFQAMLQAESEIQPTNKPLEPTSSAQ